MQVEIDKSMCMGHGRCYVNFPGVFAADDEGYGEVRVEEVSEDVGMSAIRGCPERAIAAVLVRTPQHEAMMPSSPQGKES